MPQEEIKREDRQTEIALTCPYTISANETTRRACLKWLCMAWCPFNPAAPEGSGLCGRIYGRWLE